MMTKKSKNQIKHFVLLIMLALLVTGLCLGQPTIEWQKCLGGSEKDMAYSISQTSDGGYIMAGESQSNDGDVSGIHDVYYSDYWVVKLDSSGDLVWQNCLGGSDWDRAHSISQTSDGGYIVAGESKSNDGDVSGNHGAYDYWVVKLNSSGSLVWQNSLGGSYWDEASSISQTSDGGYIVAGYVMGYSYFNDGDVSGHHGGDDFWVVKLNSSGDLVWQNSLGGNDRDVAFSISQTSDGGYIVAGESKSNDGDVSGNHGAYDYWVVKLNSSGSLVWQNSLGGSGDDKAYSISQTSDGGYIVAGYVTGYSYSNDGDVSGYHGGGDFWVVKLNSSGDLVWQNSLGGIGEDKAYSISQTSDGGYIVTGFSWSSSGDVSGRHEAWDYWVVKLDSS